MAAAARKTVHFVRHGEGAHNTATDAAGEVGYYMTDWFDADLTPKGRAQASDVGKSLATRSAGSDGSSVELVVSSP